MKHFYIGFVTGVLTLGLCVLVSHPFNTTTNRVVTTDIGTKAKICLDGVYYYALNQGLSPVYHTDGTFELCEVKNGK